MAAIPSSSSPSHLHFFPGKLELDLIKLPKPCASSGRCGGSRDPGKNGEFVDLFQQKAVQGWWACYQEGNDEPTVSIIFGLPVVFIT